MFWFDEVLTFYVASLPRSAIWKALIAHAESGTPLSHLVAKISANIFGWTPFGLRVPSIAGYLAMMLCVYAIVRRYAGPIYAMIGAFASFMIYAPSYAVQARPYGLLLGLSGVALLCWQRVSSGLRWLAIAGLFLSLATAVSLHYYAVLSLAAIGFGEIVRTFRRRRMDWAVWTALALAMAPLALLLPLIHANRMLGRGEYSNFSPATLSHAVENAKLFYLPGNGLLWAAFALTAGICLLVFDKPKPQSAISFPVPALHEMVAWAAMLLAPVEVLILGQLVTRIFHTRYGIVTVIGFSILLPLCLQRISRGSRGAALAELLVLILCFGAWYKQGYATDHSVENLNRSLTRWQQTANISRLPILVADPLAFLPLAQGGSKDVRSAVVYTPDGNEASGYKVIAAPDYSLMALRGIAPLNLPTFADFTSSHRRFLVLWDNSTADWFVPKLRGMGAALRLCGMLDSSLLFLVDLPERDAPHGDRGPTLVADSACAQNE
jgi:Dolichyl-phosphate-mannose-protein mannosyltransferase